MFNGFRSLTDLPVSGLIEFNCETSILTTYLSVNDSIPVNFNPKDLLLLSNIKPAIHNVHNNNLGVIFVSYKNKMRHFSQFLLLNSKYMMIPKHVFDLLYFTTDRCYIMCVLNQMAFNLNVEYIRNQAHSIQDDQRVNYDYVIIHLPFVVQDIAPLHFCSDNPSSNKPSYVKSKHCVRNENTGQLILKTIHTPISSMLSAPGRTKIDIDAEEKQYDYTHTHFPQTAVGTSCGLIFTADNKPWGITVSSNGSISGSMFTYFSD